MIKRLLFVSVMMSAAGVPYLLSTSSDWWAAAKSRFFGSDKPAVAAAPAPPTPAPAGNPPVQTGGAALAPVQAPGKDVPLEGYGKYELAEVINFNGSPAWVMQRWPRVTVGLAVPQLQGYRVPLVTGTAVDDVAGSLTYYFDQNHSVQMIHFRGTTGNPHELITLVTERYALARQDTNDPSLLLYQRKWNGKPTSELRIRTARVLRSDQPFTRYQVELAIKRPS